MPPALPGDGYGPGSRVPALAISPFARRGHVDHTIHDTNSILGFLTRLHALQPMPGEAELDSAMRARGQSPPGNLTNTLDLT